MNISCRCCEQFVSNEPSNRRPRKSSLLLQRMGSEEADDPVVQEVDVYLSKQLADHLYLFQYPVRPAHMPYDDVSHLAARIKPEQQKVELELSVNTDSPNYAKSKGEHYAHDVDGACTSLEDGAQRYYNSDKLDKQMLVSTPVGVSPSTFVAGIYKDGELHLTPLKGVIQLRPSFQYLDRIDAKHGRDSGAGGDSGDMPQDEDAKPVMVRFAPVETEEAKARRMASYEFVQSRRSKESWVNVQHHPIGDQFSSAECEAMFAQQTEEVPGFHMTSEDYLKQLIPKTVMTDTEKPAMPTNVLSMTELKHMTLGDQVRALLKNAKVIRFSQLLTLLPKGSDPTAMLRSLQQVALLVQGCWVVKSEVLYPEDTFSAFSGVPAQVLCRCRDYIMWHFTQNRFLVRKDIAAVIKMPTEDVKDILEQMARPKVNRGWEFLFDFDTEFVSRHPEIVQRQSMLWDALFQQMSKVLNISKADLKMAANAAANANSPPKRRRTTSRTRTKSGGTSELSDTDIVTETGARRRTLSGTADNKSKDPMNDITSEPSKSVSASHSTTSSTEPSGVDVSDDLKRELLLFVRDRMQSRFVMSVADLRQQLTLKLAQCPPGHILGTGVSDRLLEQTLQQIDAIEFPARQPGGEIVYAVVSVGGDHERLRGIVVDMLKETGRLKSAALRKRMEEEFVDNDVPSEADMKKIMKDYCSTKGGIWYLKGQMV